MASLESLSRTRKTPVSNPPSAMNLGSQPSQGCCKDKRGGESHTPCPKLLWGMMGGKLDPFPSPSPGFWLSLSAPPFLLRHGIGCLVHHSGSSHIKSCKRACQPVPQHCRFLKRKLQHLIVNFGMSHIYSFENEGEEEEEEECMSGIQKRITNTHKHGTVHHFRHRPIPIHVFRLALCVSA